MNKTIKNNIVDWSQIASRYKNADLLLGNGFSLNLNGHFSYTSLFKEFLNSCSAEEKRIFRKFNTNNFELILESLSTALSVNKMFDIKYDQIVIAINRLKEGLVNAIRNNHPTNDKIDKQQLRRIALQLSGFNNIYSLNYDLFLYHIIMHVLDAHRIKRSIKPYSDYFWGSYSPEFKKFEDYQSMDYKLVYYLHGALFIFSESYELTLKLIRNNESTELISLIEETIGTDEYWFPLFVSEGSSEEKVEAINRSYYLQFALESLKESNDKLVVFGCSLSDSDKHIVDAINNKRKDIAISIHVGSKTKEALIKRQQQYEVLFPKKNLTFFDSSTSFRFT